MKKILLAATFLMSVGLTVPALAGPISTGFTCQGDCGSTTANGVVAAPPGGGSYQYLSTSGGTWGAGQISGYGSNNSTDGSLLTSSTFSMNPGDKLSLNFNFVTTDTGYNSAYYPDYAWAALMTSSNKLVGYLFTAQSWTGGARLDQSVVSSTIATLTAPAGGSVLTNPSWSPLGSSSGTCWGNGCGYTGWAGVNYADTQTNTGSFYIAFGVSNVGDTLYDSGLAVANIVVTAAQSGNNGGTVPEPWSVALLGGGLLALGLIRRRDLV